MPPKEYIPIIAAFLTVIGSALVAFYTVTTQIKANTITASRQKWIDNLRDELSHFLGLLGTQATFLQHGSPEGTDQASMLERAFRTQMKIELLLNPNEQDHIDLIKLLTDAYEHVAEHAGTEDNRTGEFVSDIVRHSQTLLKREWERVKKGEPGWPEILERWRESF